MTKQEAIDDFKRTKEILEEAKKADGGKGFSDIDANIEQCDLAIEALENCPPKDSLCYGCHDNCKECEINDMAMI